MREERKARLARLLAPVGVTGFEGDAADAIRAEIQGFVDEIRTDALGNLIAIKHGAPDAKRMMIAAHMDRIGVMVTAFEENGFVRFAAMGGMYPRFTVGQPVRFSNGVTGVVGHETEKLYAEDGSLRNLFIDIGASSAAEAQEKVRIGDVAMIASTFLDMGKRVAQGGMDNRASCGVLVEALRALKETQYEVIAVFTVQEEVGLRGAKAIAYAEDPHYALALDVTIAYDTPKVQRANDVSLGKGAAIKVRDLSIVCHPAIREWLTNVAEKENIPYQLEVLTAGGTDVGAIHISRSGVPSGAISLPCRYVHSAFETVDMDDYDACVELLVKALGVKI